MNDTEKLKIAMEVLRTLSVEHEQLLRQNSRMETGAAYQARMLVQDYFRVAAIDSLKKITPMYPEQLSGMYYDSETGETVAFGRYASQESSTDEGQSKNKGQDEEGER